MPISKGTPQPKIRGSNNGRAKLTDRQALELRRLVRDGTVSARRAAKVMGLDPSTVADLASGKNWAHLDRLSAFDGLCLSEEGMISSGRSPSSSLRSVGIRKESVQIVHGASSVDDADEDTNPDKFGGVLF